MTIVCFTRVLLQFGAPFKIECFIGNHERYIFAMFEGCCQALFETGINNLTLTLKCSYFIIFYYYICFAYVTTQV